MNLKTIAIVGNPNCGKTTVFNALSGNKQKIGNWPGVTVEKVEALITIDDQEYKLVDLPGIYGLSANSEDEKVTRDYLLFSQADLLINVIDAANLERNLLLTVQLAELNVPMLVLLNMKDVAESRGITVNAAALAKALKLDVEYISSTSEQDLISLKKAISILSRSKPGNNSIAIKYDPKIVAACNIIEEQLSENTSTCTINTRWLAHKLLEGDTELESRLVNRGLLTEGLLAGIRHGLENVIDDDIDILMADTRYSYIADLLEGKVERKEVKTASDRIDKIVLNRIAGIPIFLAAMYWVFWLTIGLGGAFIDFFDIAFGAIFVDTPRYILDYIGSPDWLSTIIASGIGGGLQTLASFLPIMFVMFFMLSLLEDSGYMARAAFVVDRLMRFLGLPGRAFIPMLVGFGCTVPAIMATRTLENKRDKYLTILMTPFMSCGARLPVYALFAAAFFPHSGQYVVFLLYIIGIVFAVLTGLLLRNSLFAGESPPMLMELPAYHLPRMGPLLAVTMQHLKDFFTNAGRVMLIVVVILSFFNSLGADGSFGNENSERSILANVARVITPVFSSFGVRRDNWPASVALFSGLFAKEVIVASLNSLYISSETSQSTEFNILDSLSGAVLSIRDNLKALLGSIVPISAAVDELEPRQFSELRAGFHNDSGAAFAYLLFILLYVPCIATVATMNREIGFAYTLFQIIYSSSLAWFAATSFYQVFVVHNYLFFLIIISIIAVFVLALKIYSKREKFVPANEH